MATAPNNTNNPNIANTPEAIKSSLRASKGHLTRQTGALQQHAENLDRDPLSMSQLQEAADLQVRARQRYNDILEGIVYLQSIDAENFDEYEADITALDAKHRKHFDAAARAITAAERAQRTAAAGHNASGGSGSNASDYDGGPSHNRRVVERTNLKPDVLKLTSTPREKTSWQQAMKGYFTTSNFEALPVQEQQYFYYACVNVPLKEALQQASTEATPIFGDNSLTSRLDKIFLDNYPLFTRRLDFFRYTQNRGQQADDFDRQLTRYFKEADPNNLTCDELYVYVFVNNLSDDALRRRILAMPNPTMPAIRADFAEYMRTQRCADAHATKRANAAKFGNRGRSQSKGGGARGRSPSARRSIKDLKGKCYRCGASDHKGPECPHKDKTCNGCGTKGHLSSVCLKSRGGASERRGRSQ